MKFAQIMPVLMFIESLAASGIYAWCKDWGHAVYWLLAAGITAVVTYGLK
jgi:hypothetical protein